MKLGLIKNNKIRTAYYGLSIKKRLLLYFILSIFIPTSVISITIYHKSKKIITNRVDTSIQKNLNTISNTILQKIEIVDDISSLITYNSRLLTILSSKHDKSPTATIDELSSLNRILDDYSLFSSNYMNNNELFPRIYMVNRKEYNQYKIADKVYDIGSIENKKWYKSLPERAFSIAGLDEMDTVNGNIRTIKFARRLYRTDDAFNPYAALLTIDMKMDYFDDLLEKSKMTQGSTIFIINDDRVVMSKENSLAKGILKTKSVRLFGKNNSYYSYQEKVNGINMLISIKHINKLKWNIVSVSPLSELNSQLTSFNRVMAAVILACTIFSIIAALVLSEDFFKPIKYMIKSMSNVKDGNLNVDLTYRRKDEFAFLINQYKEMMKKIQELIDRLYVSELRKNRAELKRKDAELNALMAQINPHFLYNTLDSINWLAIKYDVEDISTMVKSLSNFFRYSLNNGKNIIRLGDEKIQVESYLKIQRARFKENLDYYIDLKPEIIECYTVKLILQPLVENAIIHGIEQSKSPGLIAIIGQVVDDDIEIRIVDNGIGADVDKLNEFLQNPSIESTSLGIRNVNERIKHFCGDQYGIRYCKNKNFGITAIVKLKQIRDKEATGFDAENGNSR